MVVDRLTYYSIEASNEEEAIDRVLQGEGKEINQETVEANVVK